ncbi:MAG: UDP-N-acetylmuramoyl-L-alanine--D-glutamate ligase [Pseudomonadota bacterium]
MNHKTIQFKHIWVLGLARSGLECAKKMIQLGFNVSVWDDDSKKRQACDGFNLLSPDQVSSIDQPPDCIVLSPGIASYGPEAHLAALWAKQNHITILCDVALFCMLYNKARLIAITGTNGKSTLASMIAHILDELGYEVALGGNIGTACFSLPILSDQGFYVFELSSYQLERMGDMTFDYSVITNITRDHIERHLTMENYIQAKSVALKGLGQKNAFIPVIGIDSQESLSLAKSFSNKGSNSVIEVSGKNVLKNGIGVKDHILFDDAKSILNLFDLPQLPGHHNASNIGCAWGVLKQIGVSSVGFKKALQNFKPLAHRQCKIAQYQNIVFIDDSKATNVEATLHALQAWPDCLWIVGGQGKNEDYKPLIDYALKYVHKAYLIGKMQGVLHDLMGEQKLLHICCSTLENAVEKAFIDAVKLQKERSRQISILLSPAAASFDQFENFESRGKAFASLATWHIASKNSD